MMMLAAKAHVHEHDVELLLNLMTGEARIYDTAKAQMKAQKSLRADLSEKVLHEGNLGQVAVHSTLLAALKASWCQHFAWLVHYVHPFRDLWLFSIVRPKKLGSLLYGCN